MKAHTRQFNPGDRVKSRNFADGPKWLPGKVLEGGKTIVKLKLDDSRIWRRHVDHLLPSQVQIESESIDQECAPLLSLDNDPLVAPSSEQNAENSYEEPKSKGCTWPGHSTRVSQPPDKLM